MLNFHQFIINDIKKNTFELNQIGNMDEIPLKLDITSNKIKMRKITIKTTGHKKTHFTAVMALNYNHF